MNIDQHLKKFISIILDFENLIKKNFHVLDIYNNINLKIPISGVICNKVCYEYRFHGAGCEIRFNKCIVDYDLAPIDNNTIKFSSFYFSKYLKTIGVEMEFKVVDEMLNIMVSEGNSGLLKNNFGKFEFSR